MGIVGAPSYSLNGLSIDRKERLLYRRGAVRFVVFLLHVVAPF